jgi:hypothetical protein
MESLLTLVLGTMGSQSYGGFGFLDVAIQPLLGSG